MRGANRGGWSALRDAVRTQLWPIPAIGIALAALVGVLLPRLDARIDDNLPPVAANYLFGGGAAAARAVLEAIAGSLITVTSLTFSLTVVTLQLASSQFSPRLLRTFSSDRFVQGTLALLLGTFTYALTVLRTVRTPADDQDLFVPQISVTLAFLLVSTGLHICDTARLMSRFQRPERCAARETQDVSAIRLIAASVLGIPSRACWVLASISAAARAAYFSWNMAIPAGRNCQLSVSFVAVPSGWMVKPHRT